MITLRALLLLVPAIAAFPTAPKAEADVEERSIPELSITDWAHVQSGFGIKDASDWAWQQAQELMHGDKIENKNDGDETQETIWQRLKADEHSFSRLTGLIEVSQCLMHRGLAGHDPMDALLMHSSSVVCPRRSSMIARYRSPFS